MLFSDIYSDIIKSFDTLWNFKVRGNTLEIITPFASTNHKFISVFLTFRENSYIVSDGGWIESSEYDTILNKDDDAISRLLYHYMSSFHIIETNGNGVTQYYKKTSDKLMVSSIVFDMSNFISSVVSVSSIEFTDAKEVEARKLFQKTANSYISSFVQKANIDFQGYIDNEKLIKVNAIFKCSNRSKLILLNYITGTNQTSFNNSIFKTDMIFGMANRSVYKDHIKKRVALVNNNAPGYIPIKSNHYLNFLIETTDSIQVNWTERERLSNILN